MEKEDTTVPHETLVRQIAEEMAREMHPIKALVGFTYEQLAQHYTPAARIAVKHMAKAFEQGFYIDPSEYDFPTLAVPRLLVENGFVPEPTAESLLIPKRRKK